MVKAVITQYNQKDIGLIEVPISDTYFLKMSRCIKAGKDALLRNICLEVFLQMWGSTCLGFDVDEDGSAMFGGSMMTEAYTTVFFEPITETYLVFFDDRICYQVQDANEIFLSDLKEHRLKSLSRAMKEY